jgi:hypothetical protein
MIVIDRRDRRGKASGGACPVLWIACAHLKSYEVSRV